MSDAPETPADEPAAVVPDQPTEVRPPAADLAGGGAPASSAEPEVGASAPVAEPEADAAIGGATPLPAVDDSVPAAPAWTPPAPPQATPSQDGSSSPAAVVSERPEIAIAGAFAGGLVLALILKRLAR